MLDFIEKLRTEQIKYKYPKHTLFLSNTASINENDFNNNFNNSHINTIDNIKLNNYYKNNIICNNSLQENTIRKKGFSENNSYLNSSNNSLSRNNKFNISDIYYNTDNPQNLYFKKNLKVLRKNNKDINNIVINNSVKNHIQNFLNKYSTAKSLNNFKEVGINNFSIISEPKNIKYLKKINTNNVNEVVKELEIVNDKKLDNYYLTERENKYNNYEVNDILNTESRVFSQNKNESQKEKYYKSINEGKKNKQIDNIINGKILKKMNLKKININKIKDYFNKTKIIKNNINYSKANQKNKNFRKPFTLTRIDQSAESRKNFIIKSIEKDNNSNSNSNSYFSISRNYNTIDFKSNNITTIPNINLLVEDSKNNSNKKSIINIRSTVRNLVTNKPIIKKIDLENFSNKNNNIIENEKNNYFSGQSSLTKSNGNLNQYLDGKIRNNNLTYNSPMFKINNNTLNSKNRINTTKELINRKNRAFFINEKPFSYTKNKIQSENNNNLKFEIKTTENDQNNLNRGNLFNSANFNKYITSYKNLNKAIYSPNGNNNNNIARCNYSDNNKSHQIIDMNKDFSPKYICTENQNQMEEKKSIKNKINKNFVKSNNVIRINTKKLEELNKNIYKKININKQIFKKLQKNADKKFRTEKNLLNQNPKNMFKNNKINRKKLININEQENFSINIEDSEILDNNRLDLKINKTNTIYKEINEYKSPNCTANDIVNILNSKEENLQSNDSKPNNFNESNNSIVTFREKNNNKNINLNNKNKDLDLSHLNSLYSCRFNYNNEKKSSTNLNLLNKKGNIKNSNLNNFQNENKKPKRNIQNYFCIDNSKNNKKENNKNNIKKKHKIKKIKSHKKQMKFLYSNDNNNNKKEQINKSNRAKSSNQEDKLNHKNECQRLIEKQNFLKIEPIKLHSISNYNKNDDDLLFFNNESLESQKNKAKSMKNNIYQKASTINNNIFKNKISLNKKLLTNKNNVPNLYNNLYNNKNYNNFEVYNSLMSDETNKLSDSNKYLNNQNNTFNVKKKNLYSRIPNDYNYSQFNSFRHGKNRSLNYFTIERNNNNYFLNNLNNINNQSLNLKNYYSKNNNKMDEHLNNQSNNNPQGKKNQKSEVEEEISQEEIEIEESEEENDEEEEIQSPSREEKSNTNTLSNTTKINPKEKYLLELKENGLPDLPKNEILSCNVGSLINISIYNGLPISSNISLISDSFQIFPSSDFIENLIKESSNNRKNKNDLDNNSFEQKVNSYQKYPSIINTKIFFQIICERAGNITFVFMYKDEKNKVKFTEPFYILVNPIIELNKNNNSSENINNKNIIELTGIKMQTVISKNIGKLKNDFENYFEEASLLGYNFIHFKTLQSLSSSENLYSIKDHNELNNSFFSEKYKNNNLVLNQDKKNDIFQNTIKKLKQKYCMGAITDVILTQASTESKWILEHTECAYNLENSPWLNVAYKLDEILVNYSKMFYNKKVSSNCAPYINNLKDLEETMEEIQNIVNKNNLEEYFLIQINEYIDNFKIFYNNYLLNQDKEDYIIKKKLLINEIKKDYFLRESNYNKRMNNDNFENDNNEILMNESIIYDIISQSCKNYGYKRYGVEMPVELISLLIIEKYRIKSGNNELINNIEFIQEVKNYINLINKEWLDKSKEMIKIALLNVKEFIRYQFIQLNRIGIKRDLIDSYFYVIDKNDPKKILLCNGWIMQSEDNSNYYPDITAYGTWYYFKRKVIIWKDTIKINYGEKISKTPEFLINYMTKYITYLSNIFEGLYIESLSNLPLFIAKYFIHKARQANPNIIFITQLPTLDDEIDEENNNINEAENINNKSNNIQKSFEKKFSEELGINLFVHEIIWDCSNNELVKNILSNVNSNSNMIEGKIISKFNSNLYSMSKRSDNKILFGCYKYLKYHKPFCILYDLTQDNQSYYEKYNIMAIQNAMMSSIGMLDCAIGSTRGFDQLFPFQVSSQKEQRFYQFDNNKIKNVIKNVINLKENDPNQKYQEAIFEFHTSNIILNDKNINLNIDINNIKNVKLALSFHKWKPDIIMEKINKNLFMTKINLPTGRHYYKYVIDDNFWVCDSNKPVEVDKSQNMNNLLDLNIINYMPLNDITLLRCYINSIREKFYNQKSEIFLQKNSDLFCVIRMLTESKSLINNNIEDNVVNEYRNNLVFKSNYKNSNNQNINIDSINNINTKSDSNYNNMNYANKNNNINSSYKQLILDELTPYEGYAIISRPTYNIIDDTGGKGEIIIPGKIDCVICSFSSSKEEDLEMNNFLDNEYLLGINGNIFFNKDINYLKQISTMNYYKEKTIIHFHSFPPNSVLILKFSLENEIFDLIENLNKSIEILFNKGDKFVEKYELYDINKILYQTESEERELSFKKRGTYELNIIEDNNENKSKNKIKFIYSGLHQIMDIIKRIKRNEKQNILFNDDINNNTGNIISFLEDKKLINSLYYDIAENDYLMDYIIERITNIKSFALMNDYIKNNILSNYKQLPSHIKTIFFESIIISLYQNIIRITLQNIPFNILNFGDFATALSLCRYEFFGQISTTSSFILELSKNPHNSVQNISISKGIPYNTIGSQRMYFRDTLIAFKALFLISNSYKEGKNILKIIASTLRHGLIPDFFDEGDKPRYNSRDTCWYFINAVKNYINYSKDYNFLKEDIDLIFVSDFSFNDHLQKKIKGEIKKYSLENIIHTIFQSHAKGIHFREWDYGNNNYFINNSYQKKEGFNIDIELDPNTGFIFGGNYCNNGTWMNKLGNSIKGKNKGIPATPRPGADIEIISLIYSCLDFVVDMGNKNYFKYKSVELSNGMNYPYSQWKLLIKDTFEDEFFVKRFNIDINNNYNKNDWNNNQIKGNIYKDYKNKNNVNIYEFQLRPNFLIALYISPELFSYTNIINALNNVELYLLRNENNVLGLKTLDKTDKQYNGLYNNRETNIFTTSLGFNVHNGIEHTWLFGIYLILKVKYFFNNTNNNNKATPVGNEDENQKIIKFVSNKLIPIMNIIKNNKWFGLPEMTDELGNIIKDGNQSDIKAMAIFFELIEILSKLDLENENEYSNEYIDSSNVEI